MKFTTFFAPSMLAYVRCATLPKKEFITPREELVTQRKELATQSSVETNLSGGH